MNDHILMLGESFLDDQISTSCTCGWEHSGDLESREDAVEQWENHCDVVFMEATEHNREYG